MAIEEQTARTVFKGDGSTRAFPVTWYLDAEENIIVKMTNVTTAQVKTLELGTDYTVTPSDGEYPTNGAVINYPKNSVTPALGSDYRLTVIRNVPYTQNFVFPNNTRLLPKNIEGGLDGLELQIQQINDKADNAVSIPAGMDYDNDEFVAELFDKAKLAEQSAQTATLKAQEAKESATSASQSAINAKVSETNAKSSATNASQSAQTATTKAQEASQSAQTATTKAQEATTKADEAKSSATNASQSAQTATTKANEASQSAQTATTKAQEAKSSATSAKESEDKALDYAKRAEQASGSVGNPVNDVVVQDNKITVTKGVGGSTEYMVNNVANATYSTNIESTQGYINAYEVLQTGDDTYGPKILNRDITGASIQPFYVRCFDANGFGMAGLAFCKSDIHGFLGISYANPYAYVGGGDRNRLVWYRKLAFTESPAFTGAPTAPTPDTNDTSTKIATTAFVKNQKYLQRKNTVNAQGLDFNSYTVDGMYNYGGTFTNSYSNGSVFGTLVVLNNLYNGGSGTTGTYISQTAHDANGGIYVRYRNGTQGWSTWQKLVTEEYVKNYAMKKEPTRTVLMDTWIGTGDVKLSESWRNFDELVFACTNDDKSGLRFERFSTTDLANWLADSSYPPVLAVTSVWSWTLTRNGTTDTLLKLVAEDSGIAKVIGIKY